MRFVDEHRDRFAVALLLRVLNIAESTYYQWIKQAEQPCDRDLVDLGLLSNIYEIWEAFRSGHGRPPVRCPDCNSHHRSSSTRRIAARVSDDTPAMRWSGRTRTGVQCSRRSAAGLLRGMGLS